MTEAKRQLVQAKLEILRDMTDLESIKQLIDILNDVLWDTSDNSIGFGVKEKPSEDS